MIQFVENNFHFIHTLKVNYSVFVGRRGRGQVTHYLPYNTPPAPGNYWIQLFQSTCSQAWKAIKFTKQQTEAIRKTFIFKNPPRIQRKAYLNGKWRKQSAFDFHKKKALVRRAVVNKFASSVHNIEDVEANQAIRRAKPPAFLHYHRHPRPLPLDPRRPLKPLFRPPLSYFTGIDFPSTTPLPAPDRLPGGR